MGQKELTAIRGQIAEASAEFLANIIATVQDRLEAEDIRNLIITDINTVKKVII